MKAKPAPLTQQIIAQGFAMQESLDASFSDPAHSLARLGILYHLQDGPRALSELAQLMSCGRSNLTAMTDKLEKQGWVERVPSQKDRRRVLARITDEGRRSCDAGIAELRAWEARLVEKLGVQKTSVLMSLLKEI